MKVLIIYSTVCGSSKECAEMLKERLRGGFETEIYDINDNPPSPQGFDIAVIGGSVRMAKINKKLKKYLSANAEILNQMHTALFLCCGFTENFDDYVAMQIPKSVLPSLGIHCFGGELKPHKLKGFDKLIVKMMRSEITGTDFEMQEQSRPALPEIIPENITRLADKIRSLL